MVVDLLRWVADGYVGWRLCLAMNGSLSGMDPFTKVIRFDLRGPLALVRADNAGGACTYQCPLLLLEPTFRPWLILLHFWHDYLQ
jgi:hypothetical protein